MGFTRRGKLFGSVVVVMRKGVELKNKSIVETIVNQAAVALQNRRAERALKESERKYSAIVEKGNDGIIIIQDGLIKFANPKLFKITGYNMADAIGKPFLNFISPTYRRFVLDAYKRRMSDGEVPERYEAEIISKRGAKIPVEISASMVEYENKPADMAIVRDVTERKRMEESLRESERRYRTLVEAMNAGLGVGDEHGRITYVNDKYCQIFGYSNNELIGHPVADLVPANKRKLLKEEESRLRKGERTFCEFEEIRKDGRKIFTAVSATPIFDSDGRYRGRLAVVTDITERKRAEDKLKKDIETLERLQEVLISREKSVIDLNEELKEMQKQLKEEIDSRRKSK